MDGPHVTVKFPAQVPLGVGWESIGVGPFGQVTKPFVPSVVKLFVQDKVDGSQIAETPT